MSHYLYALQASVDAPPFSTYLKIGHSNDPDKRLAAHKVGSPMPLRYAALWRFKNRSTAIEAEGACHRHFSSRWVHGEWHDLSVSEVDAFIGRFTENRCLVSRSFDGSIPPFPTFLPFTPERIARFKERHGLNDNFEPLQLSRAA